MSEKSLLVEQGKVFPARSFSRRLFFYIFKEFLLYFLCLVVGFLLFTTVFHLMDDLSDFDGKTISAGEIAIYFVCLLPEKIKYILPMCLLMATMKTVTNMCKHNEMSALRCMGISIFQAFVPFLVVGILMAAVQWVSAEIVAPPARRKAKEILMLAKRGAAAKPPSRQHFLAFRNTQRKRDWLMRSIDKRGTFTDVFIQQFNEKKKVAWELRAERGGYDPVKKRWYFKDAQMTTFREDQPWPEVKELGPTYTDPDLDEIPQTIDFFSKLKTTEELSSIQLWKVLNDPTMTIPQPTLNILRTSLYFRLFFPFSCVISVLLGVPMAVTTQRTGAMKNFLISVGMMVSFYMISQYFVLLGNNPRFPAFIAGGLPVFVYIALGIRGLWKKL